LITQQTEFNSSHYLYTPYHDWRQGKLTHRKMDRKLMVNVKLDCYVKNKKIMAF